MAQQVVERAFYELHPNPLGKLVLGLDLGKEKESPECRQQIVDDVREHRILIIKNQGVLGYKRQLEISRWFGHIESTFYDYAISPHRDILRLSNDIHEGSRNVGRNGWHIDGTALPAPFSHSIFHIISCSRKGSTDFIPLNELIQGVSDEKFAYWDRLHMTSDESGKHRHPLIYRHPETGKHVFCLHLGFTEAFIEDLDLPTERFLRPSETRKILDDIHQEIVGDHNGAKLIYRHKWEPGDLILADNLSVAHEASPETQLPREEIGLRVLHRVTVKVKADAIIQAGQNMQISFFA